MFMVNNGRVAGVFALITLLWAGSLFYATAAEAQVTAFKQAMAEAAAQDRDIASFYKSNDYEGIWTGGAAEDRQRRQALFQAIEDADAHGLPSSRYDAPALMAMLKVARTPRDLGFAEVAMSRAFLQLATDMQTGVVVPSSVDSGIKRKVPYRDRQSYLTGFAKSTPRAFFRALPPKTNEYARLMKEKLRLEELHARGGWGPAVPAKALKPGQTGEAVVALRNRLIEMGYLRRTSTQSYDQDMQQAVGQFQDMHGLTADGVAGPGTMTEINRTVEDRLKAVVVAMERERWLNRPRGDRHILVNLTDFSARIIDNDQVTFQTRAVVGKNSHDRRSPEFSDEMEHMVINPTWHVPRSIAVKEYLPMLQRDPFAAGHMRLVDARGRTVSRAAVDFTAFNRRNFPFDIKQPPSPRNALGLVKFMFPNRYNIYLHDTPQKSLFEREKRDFSHGCIRLQQPFEFAYTLLAPQEADPQGFFHSQLRTGRETTVKLEKKVPVHIIYRTAFTTAKGRTQYRRDVYGRDERIWAALNKAGVSLTAVQG